MVTETNYFNLTKTEMFQMEVQDGEGWTEKLARIMKAELKGQIIAEFKCLLTVSYGKKSEDGSRFVKTDADRDAFIQSAAFDAIFMELVSDDIKAAAFVKGVFPKFDDNKTGLPVPAAYAVPTLPAPSV
jgi:hypothetical protein